MSWGTTTDKELHKKKLTAKKLKDAEDLFDFTRKESREMFGEGNLATACSGLCDGQKCIRHKFLSGVRGCYCKLADPDKSYGRYFKDRHDRVCSLGGTNTEPESGCKGFKSDPDPRQQILRKKPIYMEKVIGRQVI